MDDASVGSVSTSNEDGAGDTEGPSEGDANLSDEACAAAGGAFGVVADRSIDLDLPAPAVQRFSAPGLAVGPQGLQASFLAPEEFDQLDPPGYTVQLGFDGKVLHPPELVDAAWAGGRWWPGDAAVLVSHCSDRVPGWTFVDSMAQPLAPSSGPPGQSGCDRPPSVAWVSDTDALVAWFDTETGCDGGARCVRVTRVSPQEQGTVVDLFSAGGSSWGPSISVAAGPTSALVAMLRVGTEMELVTQPIGLDGAATAPVSVLVPPPSPESIDSLDTMEARVVSDGGEGFYVYLGGWGFSMGRTHLGANGEVLEPLTALPPITDLTVWGVYNTDLDGVYPRPGGWVAVGRATSGGSVQTLLSALSPQGDLAGHVLLPTDAATATDGERLFALTVGGGAHLYELGCVVP